MERERQEYINRLLYEQKLHREHAAARENRDVMERGDDDSGSNLTPTQEQMYLDIIKDLKASNDELMRKLDEAEARRQESAPQQSLDKLLEMLAAKESSIEKLTEELRLSREKSAEQVKILQEKSTEQQTKSAEQIKVLQEKSAAEIKSLRSELSSFRIAMERSMMNKDAELQILRSQLYGKKSLKGRRSKRGKDQDDDSQDRDNFDGTPESLSQGSSSNTVSESEPQQQELKGTVVKKAIRPEKYKTMKAAKVVEHKNGLPRTKLAKRYMWTIVNEAQKITYFLYSSGSRSREVITSFLKEFKGALQSDGYVAYKYFDREDVPTEHLVCMAHVRAKFKDAQLTDSLANYFVDQIGKLYLIEMYNNIEGLSNNDIYRRRKIESMPILNAMKRKAEEFLKTDGGVASDNSAAERSIRPLAVGRKNYIHFGSEKSAEISAFFYSIMATCKMRGANAREYISDFFKALNAGRTDYAQMLPGLI